MSDDNKRTPTVFDDDPPWRILRKHPSALINLIQARVKRGWTRPELGKQLGVSRGIIFKVETGTTDPSLSLMLRWAKVIDAPLDIFSREPHGVDRDEAIRAEVRTGTSLRKVGRRYGISGERVRQIAKRRPRAKAATEPLAAE